MKKLEKIIIINQKGIKNIKQNSYKIFYQKNENVEKAHNKYNK